jgi:hypothetical protein
MLTLQTVITINSTRINQTLFITLIATLIQIYTLIDKIVEGAIYIERKDVSL